MGWSPTCSAGSPGSRARSGGGLRQIQGAGEDLTKAVASGDGAERIQALEHLVGELTKSRDQALRDRDAAMAIAGRARVAETRRETPIEAAVRKIRTHGEPVTRGPKGGWLVNNSKIARDDAWMIERSAKLDRPAPEA